MTTDDKWNQLKLVARQRLSFVDKPTFTESVIEFTCEPSFDPIFSLQIIWSDKIVKWRKAKWDTHTDRMMFYEQDGGAKVVLSNPEPTVDIEVGTTNYELLTDIVTHIQQLKIPPRVERLTMFTLDGSINTLSLGVDDLRTLYSWHTLPDEWIELAKLVNMLIDFQKLL